MLGVGVVREFLILSFIQFEFSLFTSLMALGATKLR